MRLNLLFKHEDKFVLDKIESAFKNGSGHIQDFGLDKKKTEL